MPGNLRYFQAAPDIAQLAILAGRNGAHRKIRTFDLSLTKGVLYP